MADFKLVVMNNGLPEYVAERVETEVDAVGQLAAMAVMTGEENGETVFVFDRDDDIVIVGPDDRPIAVWNRWEERRPQLYSGFDFAAYLEADARRRDRRHIGFRITDLDGNTVHGSADDSFGLGPNDVLVDGAVITAKAWANDRDLDVRSVSNHDLDAPVFVDVIVPRSDVPSMG